MAAKGEEMLDMVQWTTSDMYTYDKEHDLGLRMKGPGHNGRTRQTNATVYCLLDARNCSSNPSILGLSVGVEL